MRTTCRPLTQADMHLLPKYLEMYRAGAVAMAQQAGYSGRSFEATLPLVQLKIMHALRQPTGEEFIAHFTEGRLDGMLFDGPEMFTLGEKQLRCSYVEWIIAQNEGTGVGKRLLMDAVARAEMADREVMSLGVFPSNTHARDFFARNKFVEKGIIRANLDGVTCELLEMYRLLG